MIKSLNNRLTLVAFEDNTYKVFSDKRDCYSLDHDFELTELIELGLKTPEPLYEKINQLENELLACKHQLELYRNRDAEKQAICRDILTNQTGQNKVPRVPIYPVDHY
jgi:predicted DNA-binding protein YlxM (UPF0122 family)